MRRTRKNIHVGQRFGRLTVVYEAVERAGYMKIWMCQCLCGEAVFVRTATLNNGDSKSCGCYGRELSIKRFTTHGQRRTRVYRIWTHMTNRCRNPNNHKFADYGGRGIKVCERWLKFENFLADMGHPPDGHSIDRIDVNKDYCPENCRWLNGKGQANNKRNSRVLEFQGKSLTIAEWAEETGIQQATITARIDKHHWLIEDALTIPPNRKVFEKKKERVSA